MNQKTYFLISGVLFAIVALVHMARIFGGWMIVINNWSVPLDISWIGLFVTGLLAIYGLKLAGKS